MDLPHSGRLSLQWAPSLKHQQTWPCSFGSRAPGTALLLSSSSRVRSAGTWPGNAWWAAGLGHSWRRCCPHDYLPRGSPCLGHCSEKSCCYLYGLLVAAAASVPLVLQPVTCSHRDLRGSWDSFEDHALPFLTGDKKPALTLQVIMSPTPLKHFIWEWQPQ